MGLYERVPMLIVPASFFVQTYPGDTRKRLLSVVSCGPKDKRKYGRIYGVQMLIYVRYLEH